MRKFSASCVYDLSYFTLLSHIVIMQNNSCHLGTYRCVSITDDASYILRSRYEYNCNFHILTVNVGSRETASARVLEALTRQCLFELD